VKIQEALERVMSLSKADGCIAIGSESSNANIRWANNTSTSNGIAETASLTVISIVGRRVGMVSRNHFPEDLLETVVRESEQACEGKPEAADFVPLVSGGQASDWDSPHEPTDITVFGHFVPDLAQIFKRAEADDIKLFGYADHYSATVWLASSTGLRKRGRRTDGSFEVTAKTPDFKLSTWAESLTKTFQDVDLDATYSRIQQRLDWSRTNVPLPPGRYPVILEPAAVAEMTYHMYISATARDADEGRSVFSKPGGGNRIGEKLFADEITIYSDPAEPGLEIPPFVVSSGTSSFASVFDNGLDFERIDWAKGGVLRALITPRYWADKSGSRARPYIGNLIIPGSHKSLHEMIASTERALLVTRFWYIRTVDPRTLLLTGLTRDGVFLVENGEVKGAANNFRFNMSPTQMLAQVSEKGQSERTLSFFKVPPIRVSDFHMSSVSEAT
jgi:predicted Zn-dependent protease